MAAVALAVCLALLIVSVGFVSGASAQASRAIPLAGDWNGDGRSTPGWFDEGRVVLLNTKDSSSRTVRYTFGRPGDVPVVGDWNGDGKDTLGVVRDGVWHLRDSHSSGPARLSFVYGRVARGDYALAGDWDGDGRDTPGVVRRGTWYLRNSLSAGPADRAFVYGRVRDGDVPLVADWNGDGHDTPGIVRGGEWYLRLRNSAGFADVVFPYGRSTDVPVAGNWDGRGGDAVGVVRADRWYLLDTINGGAADRSLAFDPDGSVTGDVVDASTPKEPPLAPSNESGTTSRDVVADGETPLEGEAPGEAVVGVPDGWRVVWSEEFDGSGLDTAVWRPYHSTYGDGNRELQCHTPDNVSVSGGTLQITARREAVRCPNGSLREFSSGFLGTRENGVYFPRFARYEMRARIPHGQGLWPAFWLRHRDGSSVAEVDIMEYFHSQVPGRTTSTLHLDGRLNLSKQTVFVEEPTSSPQWHVWAVEIDQVADGVRFRFLVDGEQIHSFVDTQAKWALRHPGEPLFDIAVNLSVGGNWVGHPDDPLGYLRDLDRCAKWRDPGPTPDGCDAEGIVRASFPTSYEVDYVRVYQRN